MPNHSGKAGFALCFGKKRHTQNFRLSHSDIKLDCYTATNLWTSCLHSKALHINHNCTMYVWAGMYHLLQMSLHSKKKPFYQAAFKKIRTRHKVRPIGRLKYVPIFNLQPSQKNLPNARWTSVKPVSLLLFSPTA